MNYSNDTISEPWSVMPNKQDIRYFQTEDGEIFSRQDIKHSPEMRDQFKSIVTIPTGQWFSQPELKKMASEQCMARMITKLSTP